MAAARLLLESLKLGLQGRAVFFAERCVIHQRRIGCGTKPCAGRDMVGAEKAPVAGRIRAGDVRFGPPQGVHRIDPKKSGTAPRQSNGGGFQILVIPKPAIGLRAQPIKRRDPAPATPIQRGGIVRADRHERPALKPFATGMQRCIADRQSRQMNGVFGPPFGQGFTAFRDQLPVTGFGHVDVTRLIRPDDIFRRQTPGRILGLFVCECLDRHGFGPRIDPKPAQYGAQGFGRRLIQRA